ncbi:NUDIX domain-containing protein [Peribacillus kribbensis]
MWEFPGGKVEPNEDINSALVRETHNIPRVLQRKYT